MGQRASKTGSAICCSRGTLARSTGVACDKISEEVMKDTEPAIGVDMPTAPAVPAAPAAEAPAE